MGPRLTLAVASFYIGVNFTNQNLLFLGIWVGVLIFILVVEKVTTK